MLESQTFSRDLILVTEVIVFIAIFFFFILFRYISASDSPPISDAHPEAPGRHHSTTSRSTELSVVPTLVDECHALTPGANLAIALQHKL